MFAQAYRKLAGLKLSVSFNEENVRSALAYKPLPEDVFVVSYPKCGSTWLQYIVHNILTDEAPVGSMSEFMERSPFLELAGADVAVRMTRPGVIKTHLPFHRQPFSEYSKYVYIARNPYDCCVSFFHHTRLYPEYNFQDGTFDEYFDHFIEGDVLYGDFFDHVLSWYEHRRRSNVMVLTYEDLKGDTALWALRLADFLGNEYGSRLRRPQALQRLLDSVTVTSMRKTLCGEVETGANTRAPFPDFGIFPERVIPTKDDDSVKTFQSNSFIRRGEIGDWKGYFSAEQVSRMKDKIARKANNSEVMLLWEGVGLP